MKSWYPTLLCVLAVAGGSGPAHATLTTTGQWNGTTATLISPDYKVTFGTPFDLGIVVDATSNPFAAFTTSIVLSDTVRLDAADLAAASPPPAWSYDLIVNGAVVDHRSGLLGDAFAPITGTYRIDLLDPHFGTFDGFTFLGNDGEFHDQVRWALTNIVIRGDTDVTLELGDGGITDAGNFSASVIVIDPPAPGVPEPSTLLLALGAVGVLAARRRRAAPAGIVAA